MSAPTPEQPQETNAPTVLTSKSGSESSAPAALTPQPIPEIEKPDTGA